MIMLGGSMMVIVALLAVAIDGGFGDVEHRRAQNAADAASVAGAKLLNAWCERKGLSIRPSENDLYTTMSEVMSSNDPGVAWTADYIDTNGVTIPPPAWPPGYSHWFSQAPPAAAHNYPSNVPDNNPSVCGIKVNATPKWTTFFAAIVGHPTLTSATGSVANNANPSSTHVGIISLDLTSTHAVLGGGFGQFEVDSDIRLNFTGWSDAIDVKENSAMDINGGVYAPVAAPFDPFCFPPPYAFSRPWLTNRWPCGWAGLTGVISYNAVGVKPQFTDPLAEPLGAPFPTEGYVPFFVGCDAVGGGYPLPVYPPAVKATPAIWEPTILGFPTLQPGIYEFPVKITSSTRFADCSGPAGAHHYEVTSGPTSTPPGIYVMQQGLDIHLGAGQTVNGQNIMIATSAPYPAAGNVPFNPAGAGGPTFGRVMAGGVEVDGNGGPCLFNSAAGYPEERSLLLQGAAVPGGPGVLVPCAGGPGESGVPIVNQADWNVFGDCTFVAGTCVRFVHDFAGTGQNDSLIIGGAGTVNFEAAQSGLYAQMLFFQDRTHSANFGFDAYPDDKATINVLGTLYNASLGDGGPLAPTTPTCPSFATGIYHGVPQPCDGPDDYKWAPVSDGIPLRPGGILQVGYGINNADAHASRGSPGPCNSGVATVCISGVAVVTDFQTDGQSSITIAGLALDVPGASPPNPVLSK